MPVCPSCTAEISDTATVCPRCSTPTPWSPSDVTHLSDRSSAGGSQGPTRSVTSSWLSATDAIDHGRFPPGAVLDGRYRIVGRLGKGGMGEVYRADDLKLGQPVALKFLSEAVDRDPARLTQLHAEVRMARQVSHPNVCRVYDVGEFEGHTFLSMEYVDGEDLASLLRRIGRFPQDRAIELARQICAGLAAAHDRGVVHRDLKPANIMLDGIGRIRITDFGLAGIAGETIRAGTPAYMSPEQLAGGDVTPRSDIYSLGLVLYELFTGRRALEGRNLAELIAKREQAGITQPSEIVRDLDPAIDGAIMRCLEPDAARRPSSALAVAASLPGGDPLAAALAAGETPSPEMVAAAGTTSALQPAGAIAGLIVTVALLAVTVMLSDRTLVTSMVPLPKPPLLLSERAKEILAWAGQGRNTIDSAHGFVPTDYLTYLAKHPDLAARDRLQSGQPSALHFWHRGSPIVMVPTADLDRVSMTDPPMTISDMTLVLLDPEGRLIRMSVVPKQVDPPPQNASPEPAIDWKPLFAFAGLDMAAFTPVAPEWTPSNYADTRAAWTGPLPGVPGQTLRIEAAGYRGHPVSFLRVAPWTRGSRQVNTIVERTRVSWASALGTLTVFLILLSSCLVALHNIRKGRGDRRGAFRLAAFVTTVAFFVWLLNAKHVADPNVEMNRFFIGLPLWASGLLWILYLAVEPYIRRFWPSTVVGWSRLMAGQWRDALVGRDILFGVGVGLFLYLLGLSSTLLGQKLGVPTPPRVPSLDHLLGTRFVLAQVGNVVFNSLINGLFVVFGLVLLKILVRREWAAMVIAIALFAFIFGHSEPLGDAPVLRVASLLIFVSVLVMSVQRLGLLALMIVFLVSNIMQNAVLTLDTSRWFFADSALLALIPAAMAFYGFYASRGGEPLLGRRLLD